MIITFGKHKGSNIQHVPTSYLEWGFQYLESDEWRKAFNEELSRRETQKQQETIDFIASIDDHDLMEKLLRKYITQLEDKRAKSNWKRLCGIAEEKAKVIKEVFRLRLDRLEEDYQVLMEANSEKPIQQRLALERQQEMEDLHKRRSNIN
jgi:23S rRNA A2030 N6-methylase RlmJ